MALPAMRAAGEATATDHGDRVERLLEVLLAETRAMRQAVERLGPVPRLGRRDRQVLGALLPALAEAFPSGTAFVVGDALECPGVRRVAGGRSAKSLGKLLARCAGIAIGDYDIERIGVEAGAIVWCVHHQAALLSELSSGLKPA